MCLKYLLYLHSIFEYTTQNNFLRRILLYNCLSKKIGSLHNNVPSLKAVLHFLHHLWTLIWKVVVTVVTPHSSYLFSFFSSFSFLTQYLCQNKFCTLTSREKMSALKKLVINFTTSSSIFIHPAPIFLRKIGRKRDTQTLLQITNKNTVCLLFSILNRYLRVCFKT